DGVAAAELLRLPRTHRFEAVDGRDMGDAVAQLREVAAEVRVPGVAVGEVRAGNRLRHRQVDRHRLQRRVEQRLPRAVRDGARSVFAPAVHCHVDQPGQLARQVLDVDARAAVDVGRILPRQDRNLHYASTVSPLPITTTPPSETTKRLRSATASTPTCAPALITTFLSMIALRTTAPSPIWTPCIRTEPSTSAREWTCTIGERIERRTVPPETTTPAQTSELSAWPTRSCSSNTNFAGGSGSSQVRIGHSSL